MSDTSQGDGWWLASDGKWYAPESRPQAVPNFPVQPRSVTPPPGASTSEEPFPGGPPSAWTAPGTDPSLAPAPLPLFSQPSRSELEVGDAFQQPQPLLMAPPTPVRRRRTLRWLPWAVAGIFFVASVTLSVALVHEDNVANAWQKDYRTKVAKLAAAKASIASLTIQLAAQSTAKEKALDQNSALSKLVSQETTVSGELNTCVTDLRTLITTIGNDLSSGYYSDPYVSSEATTAGSDCNQAQAANQDLQSALSGVAG